MGHIKEESSTLSALNRRLLLATNPKCILNNTISAIQMPKRNPSVTDQHASSNAYVREENDGSALCHLAQVMRHQVITETVSLDIKFTSWYQSSVRNRVSG